MHFTFNTKSYSCEYVEFDANEDNEVVVTLAGNFPALEEIPLDEVSSIVNNPLFLDILRIAYKNAKFGTPLWSAFERTRRIGGSVILGFKQLDQAMAA